jgi:hypothetical protein
MPIFDNELLGNQSNREYDRADIDISSSGEAFKEIDSKIGLDLPGQFSEPFQGITAEQARNFRGGFTPMNVNSPFSVVSKSELLANQRYPLYERGVNLENIYGLQQSGLEQLGNGLIKMGAFALGSFGQQFATIPNTATALKNGVNVADLSNPDGYEASIDDWMKNVENYFPNYVTEYEKSRGLATAIPFTYGSANFWGDKILKNSGIMVGAIGGAIVQDIAIGAVTEGIGAIPLVGVQLGKASLYLNKLFSAESKIGRALGATEKTNLGRLLDLAQETGASSQRILNINKLAQAAAATKLTNGFRYGMSIYGSARTEAAIEARESYRTIKEQLTEQYKLDNYGQEPTPEAIQQIEEYATDAMNTRFGVNMALLTVSNAVQFGNLFKSFTGAQKGITSSSLDDFGSAGKIGLKEGTLDTFERKLPQTFSGKAWEFAKPKAINIFTEGVYEEGGQFATQVGVEDYYTRKYKAQGKESWDFVKEAMASTTKGMAEQFGSSEGIESMVIGAITAAITGPVVDRITGKSKADNQRLNSTLNILNQYGMTGVLSNKYEDTSRSVEIAKQMNEAVNSGNIFKFKNLKADMFFGFVNSRIPIGMHDVTIEQLQMLKDLPKEEFEKTFGMDFSSSNKTTVNEYVNALIEKANNINDISTSLNSTFSNPYNRIIDPKTDDERAEALKYSMFENWKTDLARFSYVQQDSNQRIAEIQTSISQVNPLLTNDLLMLASSEKGLKELSDSYEQKANMLSESLANLSPTERTAKREEIKKLRTLSEKISIALNSKNIDPKLFNELINFELNNQDFSQPNALRIDETSNLGTYAEDLNKIIARREKAATQFEDLSTEKGFDKYFKQEEELQKEKEEQVETSLLPQDEKFGFLNKSGKKETAEVGRDYQVPGFSPAKVRKVGEQFKVTSPTGEVKYYDTKEEAKQAADDLNVDFSELTTVKVIGLNDDGTIKVEDLAGNIQNINPSLLKGYEKLQTEEEKLAKDKETLDKQQEKLEQDSATVITINPKEGDFVGSEEQRKDASILYLSTSTPSEDTAGEVKNKLPHIVRARKFLNNLKFFNNKDKYKVILVTPNNAEELGLEGIVQLSYEKNITDPLTEDQTNVELGFMAQVYILQTPEGDFFVNEKGEALSKVGDKNPTILDDVIFQTMTSAKPITEGGYVKVRAGQEEEAERALEAYKIFRAEVFNQKGYTPYSFDISRGIPRQNKINGVREDNNVGVILGDNAEDIIANTEGLIQVVTTGKVQHKAELLSFPLGTTLIQYGDLLDFVNNKNLTNSQANTVFSLIEAIAKEMIMQSNTGKPVKINYAYSNFLQNVLYWRSKGDTRTPSQIGIDTTNMTFNVGGKAFPLSKVSESKEEIMDVLQNAFITVNNTTLKLGPSKKFTEYRADKDGNITKVEWPNYQSYLLSGKNPDGSKRSTEETPLITHTAAPTETQASYKQKYSYITDGNVLPYDKIPPKPAPAPAQPSAPGGVMIDEYELNTGKEQKFPLNAGTVLFTGNISPDGIITVDVKSNETITKLSTEPQLVAAVDGNLRALPEDIVTIDLDRSTNEDKAKLFVKLRIEGELGQKLEQQGSKPSEQTTATTPPVVKEDDSRPYGFKKGDKVQYILEVYNQREEPWRTNNIKEGEIEVISEKTKSYKFKGDPNWYRLENNIFTILKNYTKEEETKQQASKPAPTPTQPAPVSTDAKADIERRRQEDLDQLEFKFGGWAIQTSEVEAELMTGQDDKHVVTVALKANTNTGYKNSSALSGRFDTRKEAKEFIENIVKPKLSEKINAKYDAELAALEGEEEIDTTEEVQTRLNQDLGVTSKITINTYLNGLHYLQTEDGKYYIIPDSNASGYAAENAKEVTKEQIIKPFRTEAEWKKVGIGTVALEGVKPAEEAPVDLSQIKKDDSKDPSEYRMVGVADEERMTNAEFEIFKAWHAEKVPFIPFEVLERMIQVNNNEEAWGVFEDGVAKFVRGGLRGTEYHEIGHGIWTMLSAAEQQAILADERSKSGTFKDRASGKTYSYSDPNVTDKMLEERIWDDFSDYRLGKLPAKSLGERIRRLFKMVMDFFKSFVTKPSLKDELFKEIESGRFKETKLSERVKTMAPKYRAIAGLTEQQTNDYVQDMVAQIKLIIFQEGRKDLLFNPEKMSGADVLNILKGKYEKKGHIAAIGENRYNQLVKRATEYLKTIGVTINADEVVSINDEERTGKEYAQDPFSTDWKKYSTGALKFLLSTLTERNALNQTNVQVGTKLNPAKEVKSEQVDGLKLLNFNRVFVTLMDRLHNTNDVDVFIEKLVQLAKEDSNYLPLFRALGGDLETHTIDFGNQEFKESDWRLFIQFFNTFSRQKPEAVIQYTTEDLKVYSGPANIFTTINQTVDSWVDNMKVIGKGDGGIIAYDKKDKLYRINTAALAKLPIKKSLDQLNFLAKIGVEFPIGTYEALSNKQQIIKGKKSSELEQFIDAVDKIHTYLGKNNELMTFDAKKLDINGPLRTLAELYVKINNPNQDSTYFGVEGQRISSFAENDAPSYFQNDFNESKTLDELLEKRPELNDVFSRGSQVLKKGGLFFDKDGNRIAEIKVEYIQGSKNAFTEKNKTTARLELGDRFIQEMNQNINGKYYVLIPGDSSTEWMMNLGNVISMEDVLDGSYWNKVNTIYNAYLEDEINLALEDRKQNKYVRNKAQELRFMKDLLPSKIVEKIEKMIEDDSTFADIQKYVSDNRDEINASIKSTFESISEDTFNILLNNKKIIEVGENSYMFMGLDTEFMSKYRLRENLSKDQVMEIINFLNLNYEINNIEYHKFVFGDPYQFKTEKGKLDETKRIKSFLSPRRRTFNHPEFNNFLKRTYNSVDGIALDNKTPGYHSYKSYANTATFNDVEIVGSIATLPNIPQEIRDAYSTDEKGKPRVNETDAMSWLMDNTHKEIALKEGQWSTEAEAFHQWQMAYTRRAFDKKGIKKYDNEALRKHDDALLSKDMPNYKLAVRKPIVSGNKANKKEIDLVLDKTSQMPLYYHMVEGTALEDMYIKMFDQEIGYGIVTSGRKVGIETPHSIYNADGKFNEAPIENIIEVPWSAYGTQVETMSEGEKTQTRGSQLTKMSSMDLYDNGEPTSPEAKEAYEENMKFLNLLNENAYNTLLERLGVTDLDGEFVMEDGTAVSATLMGEMLRRELSENAKDTIQLDPETQQFLIPFEASPSYLQIKSILYSLVNNALVSPKMNGAPHVQVPVTMFEKATKGRDLVRKIDGEWKKITRKEYDSLTEEEKKGVVLTDSTLKFYTPESPYCEIMLPAWFKKQLKIGKFKNYTDDQLIDYLNKTLDGKKILSGIGFRIPTQALSSVEVFRVKDFLPEYMGYTVVVPSEITTKAGSDFDIDKLNIYLKSIYLDENENIKLVSYKGSEQATKDFYAEVWTRTREKEIQNIQDKDAFREDLYKLFSTLEGLTVPLTKEQQAFYDRHFNIINDIIDQADEKDMIPSEYMLNQISKLAIKESELTSDLLSGLGKEEYVKKMYKKALENEYYASLEKLLTLKENFNKLISPVDDAGLEKMSETLDEARGYNETGIKARLINRNYMTNMRHAFITGKRWVGIAAVNITNLSLRQKSKVYLDDSKIPLLDKRERDFVKNLDIILPHNTVDVNGKKYVSLSGTMTQDGKQLISQRLSGYATAFVDIANKPFITKIIKSDVVVSTFMFLESIGAGNTGIYFLNQPIIEKYLEYLDSKGSKNVINNDDLNYIKSLFPTTEKQLRETQISVDGLLGNIEEYGEKGKFDQKKNAEQQLILNEFIKYKILADQLFSYTQATNYDTTRFSSSDTYLKKEWGTMNAANYNLISNVQDVLGKTFIGKLSELLSNSYQALGAVMITENPKIKAYTLSTLKRYATKKYMSLNDYEKISNLIKNSFIDFVIQNNATVREMIKPLLVDSETSIVDQLEKAKQKYPTNQLLQDLVPVLGNREKSAKSITLKVNIKDANSENFYTGMMRELRDSGEKDLQDLYTNIINVSILQGTGQSAISIRNIIPIEDYADKIAPIFQQLQANNMLEPFENAMFERNNFRNTDVFQEFRPGSYTVERINPNTGELDNVYEFPSLNVTNFPKMTMLKLSDKYNSFNLSSDFLKVPKVITTKNGTKVNALTGFVVSKADYAKMKQKGDFNLFDAYYYKKVYTKSLDEFGNPISLSKLNKKGDREYYYKLINVYGDGDRAVEMNTNFTPSVIDNGSMRIPNEVSDEQIVSMINPGIEEEIVPLPTETSTQTVTEQVVTPGEQLELFSEEDLGLNTDFNQDDFKC